MILKLRMISDENESFVRDYELVDSATLLSLHDFICEDLDFDRTNFCSIFSADEDWHKITEYTLSQIPDNELSLGIPCLPMDDITLKSAVAEGVSRFIYVFDMLSGRSLYIEIVGVHPENDKLTYPRVADAQGEPPVQNSDFDIELDADPFNDMMEDFAGFEDFGYSDYADSDDDF